MLVSFLVPVYNVKNYIRECLESILVQKGASYEIILLNDGSYDGSEKICDEYAKKYPDLIRVIHKENEGLLATRRRGFEEAKGDWFACVDSDDFIKPNYLETVIETIEEYECDMLMFDYESFYPDGYVEDSGIDIKNIQIFERDNKEELLKKRLLKNKYNNIWSKVIKRDVIDFETDYRIHNVKNMCEDAIQSYELYTRANKIVFIPQVLYSYRRNITSITSNLNMDYWYALRVSYELGWKYIKLWNVSEEVSCAYAARCVSYYCDFIGWLFLRSGIVCKEQIDKLIKETMLQREEFILATELYKTKYLTTKYLRIRNPIVIELLKKFKSYKMIKWIYKVEVILKG